MSDAPKALLVGQALWAGLADAFREVCEANGFIDHAQQAQMWAGFLAAASGAMAADIGQLHAQVVLKGVVGALADALPAARAH